MNDLNRRDLLRAGVGTAAFALAQLVTPDFVFPGQGEEETLVPFENMPRARPGMLDWETLDSWLTPQDQVFNVSHYGVPKVDPAEYSLEVTGLVEKPFSLSLAELKERESHDELMTLECAGNGAGKGFMAAIYNSKWTGTPLLPLLEEAGVKDSAKEVVFIGHDTNEETIRKGGRGELTFTVPFGRSMSIEDVQAKQPLVAYERNGEPLTQPNGSPVRLIVPGWYGIANVKWLKRIELRDTRYMGKYMGREYVTVRGEKRGGEVVFVETSITKMNLKSIIARVTKGRPTDKGPICKAYGAVWGDGTPIKSVEVKVDDGDWVKATLDEEPRSKFCWTFFSLDLGPLAPGKHTLVSRATDESGRVQPTAEDDVIALKKTYWEAFQQWPREIEIEA